MRLKLTFEAPGGLKLPFHYHYILQGFVLHNISRPLAEFIHSVGYGNGNKVYKLLTFSNLYGKNKVFKREKQIFFPQSFHFYISSYDLNVLSDIVKQLIGARNLNIAGQEVFLSSIESFEESIITERVILKTLSPITVHETINGKTVYYNPYQEKFYQLLIRNLISKYSVITGQAFSDSIEILQIKNSKYRKVITFYKNNFVIEAWKGKFEIKAPLKIIEIALKTGLGARNAQGFGMVAVDKSGEN
ncbi:CRISPR-associated endoribonuclease Cas6 [Desulfurobacterium atlanticum]|uniref:CRISPR-associated endoribonuclease n=1 Tax=Desulfurobacterium atlanticum TaxID=240169 RepID=A0A239A1D6_9BACT|nr:CRISPR-associated endoribonuclease Cas6 [Desulfurobacterium atlanticum]SNR89467.1 CRISPR-associated protein, Cas6 family [Desulfurobacterium atlanticum]